MKKAQIIHNPSAGDGGHTKNEVVQIVEKRGYRTRYISTKDHSAWENLGLHDADVIFVAGGDGTMHKLAEALLTKMPNRRIPIYLLPKGTANNIAKTLQVSAVGQCNSINLERNTKKFDCGKVIGLPKNHFFFESVGFGIFPELIFEMKRNAPDKVPSRELHQAVKKLLEIVKIFEPKKTTIKVDGISIEGEFLLVELMNIQYLGPNLHLAPDADPGDGYFDLVLIQEKQRDELLYFLDKIIDGNTENSNLEEFVKTIRVRNIEMECTDVKLHIDDHLVEDYSGNILELKIVPGALKFVRNMNI